MTNETLVTLALLGGCALVCLVFMVRLGKFWLGWLFSAASGLAALWLVNAAAAHTGVSLPISLLSLGAAALGGIPGVVVMLALRLLWPV